MSLYFRLLSYVRPYALRITIAILCTMMAAGCNLYLPWIIKDVVDRVLVDKDTVMLNYIAASIVIVFIIRGIFFYGQSYLMSWVGQKVVIDIRGAIFRKLQRLSMSFYDKNKTGTIMSYVTNDVAALQTAMVDKAVEFVTEGLILVGSIAAMLWLDWKLTLFTFCTFPAVLWCMDYFGKKIRKNGGEIQACTAELTSVLQESVSSARVIKSFVREEYETNKFDNQNRENFYANMKNIRLNSLLTPVVEFVAAVGVTIVMWYGGRSVIDGDITAGALVAFLTYAVNIANPIKRLTRVAASIQQALAAGERVFGILDLPEAIQEEPNAKALPPVKGKVEFDNVKFSYNPDEEVLNGLTFTVNPGEVTAITGGDIRIDGYSIKDLTLDSLRGQVGIVPQETMLFNGSVYDNILYGRLDAREEEVYAAAKAANADEFIRQLPQGYETQLGDRGVNISGGQRQRIAIARAILKNPRILILDEATSALDTESERVVQEALDRLMIGRTSFVIAHRLSTIKNADKILVLEHGELVEAGTHDELIAQNGLYAHLYQIQYRNKETK